MTSSVDNIIKSSHNVNVFIIINETSITTSIVTWRIRKILVFKSLVVTPDSKHETWWHWE